VGKFTDDDLTSVFEEKICHICNKVGKIITDVTWKGKGVYYFAGNDPKKTNVLSFLMPLLT